ncbi:hypothetical protein EPI10_025574 [Gossypium australe]|uniref:Uncharacterized protein n=1 Tax=Gossypium australe TaxID=47621 RepID=A0A5B6W2H0_9ROSI|nr:hypothetical protein EPI10_025574 [Gossypium australe]
MYAFLLPEKFGLIMGKSALAAARKSGLGRATKKVRQREDDPSDVGDMAVDRGEEAPVTFKDKLIGWDRNNKGEEDYEDDDFDLKEGVMITEMVDGIPK